MLHPSLRRLFCNIVKNQRYILLPNIVSVLKLIYYSRRAVGSYLCSTTGFCNTTPQCSTSLYNITITRSTHSNITPEEAQIPNKRTDQTSTTQISNKEQEETQKTTHSTETDLHSPASTHSNSTSASTSGIFTHLFSFIYRISCIIFLLLQYLFFHFSDPTEPLGMQTSPSFDTSYSLFFLLSFLRFPSFFLLLFCLIGPMDEADDFLADMNFKAAIQKYTEAIHAPSPPCFPPQTLGVPLEEAFSRRAQCYHRLRMFREARV